jgi:hypothetical protein
MQLLVENGGGRCDVFASPGKTWQKEGRNLSCAVAKTAGFCFLRFSLFRL